MKNSPKRTIGFIAALVAAVGILIFIICIVTDNMFIGFDFNPLPFTSIIIAAISIIVSLICFEKKFYIGGNGLWIPIDFGKKKKNTAQQTVVVAATPKKQCSSCHKPVDIDAAFCSHCGTSLSTLCPHCGGMLMKDDVFCMHCGNKVA